MSFTLQSVAVHADAATFSAELPRRRSDKALEAYLSLDPENRPASYQYEDIQILFPDAARAAELAREAEHAVMVDRDPIAAIHRLEDAIRLDQISALDGDRLARRAAERSFTRRRRPTQPQKRTRADTRGSGPRWRAR